MSSFRLAALAAFAFLSIDCSKEAPAPVREAPPQAVSATAAAGATRLTIAPGGTASFLIDAPLEKIKGQSSKLRGYIDVDSHDLRATRGMIEVDLDDLTTSTFDDADKNKTQTGHAHNWLEIGSDVAAARREENRWARFTIKSIQELPAGAVAAAEGERVAAVEASGDFWMHGVTAAKTVRVELAFSGPADAPSAVRFKTSAPLRVSLREHDVKPRDLAGKFLAGALEKVGQKIDDTVQVTIDARAVRP
jgi:hypothetical protein